jgi:hypothetical protein
MSIAYSHLMSGRRRTISTALAKGDYQAGIEAVVMFRAVLPFMNQS